MSVGFDRNRLPIHSQEITASRSIFSMRRSKTIDLSELTIVEKSMPGKFYILVCQSEKTKRKYVIKLFHKDHKHAGQCFATEKQFCSIYHPNILTPLCTEESIEVEIQGKPVEGYATIMDYAPFGDFYNLLVVQEIQFDEKLIRTYFHQLIRGVEYLHSQNIFHLDLKIENLLLNENFQLLITDFDMAYKQGSGEIRSKGSKVYRAPELIRNRCTNPAAADMYSIGIILFAMKTYGYLPYYEDQLIQGIDLHQLLLKKDKSFWNAHIKLLRLSPDFFRNDFKELFESLVEVDVSKRATIADIKSSKWYNGPVYSNSELAYIMKSKLQAKKQFSG